MALRIFLSAVTAQLKDCRDALASDLHANCCEVQVQEDFQQGGGTLLERLQEYVDSCDRVIAIVGDAYGCDAVPQVREPRSYTQWEYFFALGERLSGTNVAPKDLRVYFASPEFLASHRVQQTEAEADKQRTFIRAIKDSGKHWSEFSTVDRLCRLALRDGLGVDKRPGEERNLPYPSLGNLFAGRKQVLEDLCRRFRSAPHTPVAIHGVGGTGKTRLAVEYAYRHQTDRSALLFVKADSPVELRLNLASLCETDALSLPERGDTEEERREAALRWLKTHSGWLLILDSVDTPDAAESVEDLLPRLASGHVLISTRIAEWSAGVDAFELPTLEHHEAVAFLLRRTRGRRCARESDREDAAALATDLGGLPLALEQASAFITKHRLSIADYIARWRARETTVRTWNDARLTKYPCPALATWDTTLEQLALPARALLQILSWFAPAPIPRSLLQAPAAATALGGSFVQQEDSTGIAGVTAIDAAIADLAAFSLLTWHTSNEKFSIHGLIQEVTRDRLTESERTASLKAALSVLTAALPTGATPDDIRSWPFWLQMRPHVAAVAWAADEARVAPLMTNELLAELGAFLTARAEWGEAEKSLRRALDIGHDAFFPADPRVAQDLSNLAALLTATNRHAEAEQLLRSALRIQEGLFSPADPRIAASLNNLAELLRVTNKLPEAERLFRRALDIDENALGPVHPEVATLANNLALLLQDTSRLAEAERLFRRALDINEKAFGPLHPKVALGLNNLAVLLQLMKRHPEAERPLQRALNIDEHAFGPLHPRVAIRLNNLALLFHQTNRLADGEALFRRALDIDESTFGPMHPDVAIDLANLAMVLKDTSRPDEAAPLLQRALAINENAYGPSHPSVALCLNNLAHVLKDMQKFKEAEKHMRRSLEILVHCTQACGHEHPNLRTTIENYGQHLQALGLSKPQILDQLQQLLAPILVQLGDPPVS